MGSWRAHPPAVCLRMTAGSRPGNSGSPHFRRAGGAAYSDSPAPVGGFQQSDRVVAADGDKVPGGLLSVARSGGRVHGFAMKLTPEQIEAVKAWAAESETLSGIQKRLKSDLGVSLTYLETRMLVGDLGLELEEWKPKPKEEEPAEAAESMPPPESPLDPAPDAGGVKVTVDKITRPGAMVSGRATFSDGKGSGWYVDQYGRLGLEPATPGYRPPPDDIPAFQAALDRELRKLGL